MPEEEREEEDAKVFCPGLTKAVLNQIKKQQKKSLNMDINQEAMKVKSLKTNPFQPLILKYNL